MQKVYLGSTQSWVFPSKQAYTIYIYVMKEEEMFKGEWIHDLSGTFFRVFLYKW